MPVWEGLAKLYDGVSGNLIDPEVATLSFKNDMLKIEALQDKIDAQEAEVAEKAAKAATLSAFEAGLVAIAEDKGWEAAIATLSEPETIKKLQAAGIEFKEIDSALGDLRSFGKHAQAMDKKETDRRIEQQNKTVDDAIEQGLPNINAIIEDQPDLTVKQKNEWEKFARDHNQAILDDDIANSPVNLHDPLVYNNLLFTARHNPNDPAIQPDALFDAVKKGRADTKDGEYVPGGITTAQLTEIEDQREETLANLAKKPKEADELKRPEVKRAHSSLNRLTAQDVLIFAGPVGDRTEADIPKVNKIEETWREIHNDLDRAILDAKKAGKPLTDKEIEEKTKILTRPIIEKTVLGGFSRFFRKERGGQFFGLVKSEEKALIDKRVDSLREQPLFEDLNPDEQERAIELVETGSTVEEAVLQIEAGEDIPTITTKAEQAKLEKGTRYRGPDGKIAVKR